MTVGELREALASVPDDAAVMLIFEDVLRHAVGVTVAPNGAIAVIRNRGQSRYKHYSVAEDGLIGGLSAMGMSNEAIAELLERTSDSIRKRKKSIGLS
jgi:hypothetical protein